MYMSIVVKLLFKRLMLALNGAAMQVWLIRFQKNPRFKRVSLLRCTRMYFSVYNTQSGHHNHIFPSSHSNPGVVKPKRHRIKESLRFAGKGLCKYREYRSLRSSPDF